MMKATVKVEALTEVHYFKHHPGCSGHSSNSKKPMKEMVVCLILIIASKFTKLVLMTWINIKVLPRTIALKISFLFPANSVASI